MTIPGFLVIGAIVYAIIASGSMLLIGSRFVRVAETKNQAEAEYRYALTRVRENGESIALIGGEPEERAGLDASLRNVLRRWRAVCVQTMRTTIVYQGSGIIAPVFPIILCAPKFLDGSMSLGQIMQVASAFVIVQQASAGWSKLSEVRRLDGVGAPRRLAPGLAGSARPGRSVGRRHHRARGEQGRGAAAGEPVGHARRRHGRGQRDRGGDRAGREGPGGRGVGHRQELARAGDRRPVAVGRRQAAAEIGRAAVHAAAAALHPDRHLAARHLLSERRRGGVGRGVAKAMKDVGLDDLVDALDEEKPWDQTLSGGEKQRVAFARVLVQQPDIIVMDEGTSALDPKSQEHLMNLVQERSPKMTIISVGHRPELEKFHQRKLVLEARREGAKLAARYRSAGAAEAAMALAAARPQGSGQGQSSGLDCRIDVAGTQGRNRPAYRLLVVASVQPQTGFPGGSWEADMAMVTIRCPVDRAAGLNRDRDGPGKRQPNSADQCATGLSGCGQMHVWSILEARARQ